MSQGIEPRPIKLEPQFHQRVWGGARLQPGVESIGEAWVIYEGNRVLTSPWEGKTLADLAAEMGEWLLGSASVDRTGSRFPLLIKLLDANDWLSVQVHPNDEQARNLEGDEHFGKTEAWHILDAAPDAEIIFGLTPGVGAAEFAAAVGEGRTLETIHRVSTTAGDTYFIPAGTVHALGPGLLLYEVQQTSDITYRVYDWDRPASEGRALHIAQALEVVTPESGARHHRLPSATAAVTQLVDSEHFILERRHVAAEPEAVTMDGRSFHAVTVIDGQATVSTGGHDADLGHFESVVIPAASGEYRILANEPATILVARTA
jgi:mannose-6-phosphate isomerase